MTQRSATVLDDRSRIETRAPLDERIDDLDIHVIGAGATGGPLVRLLAKQGYAGSGRLHVWDHDTVARNNLANQVYLPGQIGMNKVEALKELVSQDTGGHEIVVHAKKADENSLFSGVVFFMLDSLLTRYDLWDTCVAYSPDVQVLFDLRLAVGQYNLHCFDPMQDDDVFKEMTARRAPKANVCRDVTNMNSTASIGAGEMVDWFSVWLRRQVYGKKIMPLPIRSITFIHPKRVIQTKRGDSK